MRVSDESKVNGEITPSFLRIINSEDTPPPVICSTSLLPLSGLARDQTDLKTPEFNMYVLHFSVSLCQDTKPNLIISVFLLLFLLMLRCKAADEYCSYLI